MKVQSATKSQLQLINEAVSKGEDDLSDVLIAIRAAGVMAERLGTDIAILGDLKTVIYDESLENVLEVLRYDRPFYK